MTRLTKGNPLCPACEGRGYIFDSRGKYLYCDCEKNIREGRVSVKSDCFRHGPFDGVFCPTCEREAGR